MRYDVAIIGAGPAGAWCACRLAMAGARVALIDGSHPREKPCGGGVTARALALVGDHASAAVNQGVAIDSARFSYRGRNVGVPLADPGRPLRLGVFPRRDFDARLVSRAAAAGADLIAEHAIDATWESSGWIVRTRTPSTRPSTRFARSGQAPTAGSARMGTVVHATWIVGADGPGSMVRKRVSRPFDRADLSIACGHFVHGVTSTRIDVAFEDAPAGYLWSFPRRDHLAVGICAQADAASVATLMPIADRWIAENVNGGTLERYSWPIPSLSEAALEKERPAGNGWMLAGDAAGLVDSITREGIFFALESGAAAAASLIEARNSAGRYIERLRDTAYRELMLAARIKARFYRPAFMRLLITGLQRSERIRRILADLVAGEQPYATLRPRLLRTMEWKLMMELFLR